MANWNNPTTSTTYTNVLTELKDRDVSLAKMFDGVSDTNLPTGAIRWGSSNHRWEKWNGSAWVNLDTVLTDVLAKGNNLSDLTSPSNARSNLGLGTLATLSSVNNANWSGTALAVANGGTGATDAATARANLGLGTLATSSAVLGALATLSTINNAHWSGTALAVANGGTGSTTSAGALTNLGAVSTSSFAAHTSAVNPHGLTRADIGAAQGGANLDITSLGVCGVVNSGSANLTLQTGAGAYDLFLSPGQNLLFSPGGGIKWYIPGSGNALTPNGTQDIGTGAARVRDLYFSNKLRLASPKNFNIGTYASTRTFSNTTTLQNLANNVATLIKDLEDIGLFTTS